MLYLLRSALLECISDHRTYTQELGIAAGISLVHWVLFQDLLDHLIYLIRCLDLGLTLVDKKWLKPVGIDPGDGALEPAQFLLFFLFLKDVVCTLVWRGENRWISVRVEHG